jgi:signal transduction histidine kinase
MTHQPNETNPPDFNMLTEEELLLALQVADGRTRPAILALRSAYAEIENLQEKIKGADGEIDRLRGDVRRFVLLEKLPELALKIRISKLESLLSEAVEMAKYYAGANDVELIDEEGVRARAFLAKVAKVAKVTKYRSSNEEPKEGK